ncbi:MAG: PilZ domain-containing protein [Nitrospirae bacterium]|jgi:hypothetical protein|nr:PilZ domain-containing protein [Nitrospirota bacterium]
MFNKNLRSHERTPFVDSLEYSVAIMDFNRLKAVEDVAVVIDMSKKGMGILTNQPLNVGNVLNFKKNNKIPSHTAVVKWAKMIDETTCRAGIKFT